MVTALAAKSAPSEYASAQALVAAAFVVEHQSPLEVIAPPASRGHFLGLPVPSFVSSQQRDALSWGTMTVSASSSVMKPSSLPATVNVSLSGMQLCSGLRPSELYLPMQF